MIRGSATGSMMTSSPASTPPPPAALSAFLRGCERRGAVFAELQAGDPERGDVALAATLRAFRAHAAALPLADWPRRFWALLVATPPLRAAAPGARWPSALQPLSLAAPADRAALLLRLVAGLQEDDAAAVLGWTTEAYQQALARACPRGAAGEPDAVAWRGLADAVQQHLRDLPPARLTRLARLREDALAGTRIPPTAPAPLRAPPPQGKERLPAARRRWPWVVLVLALVAAALAATWFWPPAVPGSRSPSGAARAGEGVPEAAPALTEPLPPAEAPAARFDAQVAITTHADFELLADPDGEAIARQADFLAWYIAQAGNDPAVPAQEVPHAAP